MYIYIYICIYTYIYMYIYIYCVCASSLSIPVVLQIPSRCWCLSHPPIDINHWGYHPISAKPPTRYGALPSFDLDMCWIQGTSPDQRLRWSTASHGDHQKFPSTASLHQLRHRWATGRRFSPATLKMAFRLLDKIPSLLIKNIPHFGWFWCNPNFAGEHSIFAAQNSIFPERYCKYLLGIFTTSHEAILALVDGNFGCIAATSFFAARLQWVALNVTTSQYDVDRHTYDSYDSWHNAGMWKVFVT